MFRFPPAEEDVVITHLKGSGPGGQNRNKRMSGIRIEHLPTGIVVMATERRSQKQNLEAAQERLMARLRALLYKPKPRKDTKPTRSSKERRLGAKSQHSKIKSMRRSKAFDGD